MNSISFESRENFNNSVQFYSKGFESELYRYVYDGKEILLKKYYDQKQVNLDKINRVSSLTTDGLIKPKILLEIENHIEGFGMDFKRGCYPLSNQKYFLNEKQKYNLIMRLKQILLSLRMEGCIYGDLNLDNIITDGNEVYLCDSINMKIDNFNFDEISSTMHKYIERTGTTDGIDIYMLNLLTICLFNDIEYDSIIERIELAVMNMFNKQPFDNVIGGTDSIEILNICCDIFLSNQVCDKLLIDYIDINILDNKVSKI